MTEDYKLILISDNSNKTKVRYRKKNDQHWQTIYLNETDTDALIDQMTKELKSVE